MMHIDEIPRPSVGASLSRLSPMRQEIFDQIHRIYLTDHPFIVLSGENILAIVRKGTNNYQPNPFEFEVINVWEWGCDNGKC